MTQLIKARLRHIGTSTGVILPKEVLDKQDLKAGDEIEIAILKRNLRLLDEAFGKARGAKFKFQRDKDDRI